MGLFFVLLNSGNCVPQLVFVHSNLFLRFALLFDFCFLGICFAVVVEHLGSAVALLFCSAELLLLSRAGLFANLFVVDRLSNSPGVLLVGYLVGLYSMGTRCGAFRLLLRL